MEGGHGLRPDWGLVRLRQGGVGLTLSGAKCNYFFYFLWFPHTEVPYLSTHAY
jgi:hypothetical protein